MASETGMQSRIIVSVYSDKQEQKAYYHGL